MKQFQIHIHPLSEVQKRNTIPSNYIVIINSIQWKIMFKSYFQKTTAKKAGKVRNTMEIKQEKAILILTLRKLIFLKSRFLKRILKMGAEG